TTGTGGFPLGVLFNASGLAPGIYSGSVTISSDQAVNAPVTVPVTMNVLPTTISASAPSFSASATVGGSNPSNQAFNVNNGGSGAAFGFSAVASVATPPGGSWLSLSGGSANTPSSFFQVMFNI